MGSLIFLQIIYLLKYKVVSLDIFTSGKKIRQFDVTNTLLL